MWTETLSKIYYDRTDPGYLSRVERLLQRARQLHVPGVTLKTVHEYLKSEQAYSLHKPVRRRFISNHTYVAGIDAQWQTDLADMQGIARQNYGMRYLHTVINIFSKFAWAVPVHSKDAKAIAAAVRQVLTIANSRQPKRRQTDKRKKFFDSNFQTLMKRHGIQNVASESKQNTAVV